MHSCISGNAFPPTISVLRVESSFLLQFCIHVSVAQIILPGGSQAHSGTLTFYCGLRQAQILYVDSTCKTCGGVKPSVGYYKKTYPRCYVITWSPQSGFWTVLPRTIRSSGSAPTKSQTTIQTPA